MKNNSRNDIGFIVCLIGLICNIILFIVKFIVGQLTNSIVITSDAFNNLSDGGGFLVSVLAFKKAAKGGDSQHPLGYGRVEYIFGLVVSFMICFTAVKIGKMSFEALFSARHIEYNLTILIIMIGTVLVKVFLSIYNLRVGKKINSPLIKGMSKDSIADAFITSAAIISMLIGKYISLPIDGIMGIFIAVWILFAGCNLAEENLHLLLGKGADENFVKEIGSALTSYAFVQNYKNLILHDYGHENRYATVYILVKESDIQTAVSCLDEMLKTIYEKFNIRITIQLEIIKDKVD